MRKTFGAVRSIRVALAVAATCAANPVVAQAKFHETTIGNWVLFDVPDAPSLPFLVVANVPGVAARRACHGLSAESRNPNSPESQVKRGPEYACLIVQCVNAANLQFIHVLFNTEPHGRNTATPAGRVSLYMTLLPGGRERAILENASEERPPEARPPFVFDYLPNFPSYVPGEPIMVALAIVVRGAFVAEFGRHARVRFRVPSNGPVVEARSRFHDPDRHPANAGRNDIEFDLSGTADALVALNANCARKREMRNR